MERRQANQRCVCHHLTLLSPSADTARQRQGAPEVSLMPQGGEGTPHILRAVPRFYISRGQQEPQTLRRGDIISQRVGWTRTTFFPPRSSPHLALNVNAGSCTGRKRVVKPGNKAPDFRPESQKGELPRGQESTRGSETPRPSISHWAHPKAAQACADPKRPSRTDEPGLCYGTASRWQPAGQADSTATGLKTQETPKPRNLT